MPDLLLQRTRRFELAVPATFWWMSANGSLNTCTGFTRNVSNSGVLITASECPPLSAAIQIEILLPRSEGSGYGMKLQGEGVVVRMYELERAEFAERQYAFAATVTFYPEQLDVSE